MSRIMLVVESTGGGTARHIFHLALGCLDRGFIVHLVCATRRDVKFRSILNRLCQAGVIIDEFDMVRHLDPVRDISAAIRLRRKILNTCPDIIHLHSSKAGGVGRLAVIGLNRNRPFVVYTPHAYAFLTQFGMLKRWKYWCIERALVNWTDYVVAVSESEGSAAARLGAKDRIVVIPNGVYASNRSAQRLKQSARLRIGWLGRMVWQKAPEIAVKVSILLAHRGIDHDLFLGGSGDHDRRIRNLIRESHAENWIHMLGYVDDLDDFYARIDVLLITSRVEGLPYSGLDAMARGIPIVGFNVPGVNDLVIDGVTGLLAPVEEIHTLVEQIAWLSQNEQVRKDFGVAAQLRAKIDFRIRDQLDHLCDFYRCLSSGDGAPETQIHNWAKA